MDTKKIVTGKITEQKLVNLFGSDAQKKSYKKNGRFIGSYKSAIFKKIRKYCNIKELGKEKGKMVYEISEVYKHPLPSNYDKMTKSLYKYIIPLILESLINGHDKNNSIDITVGKWAREISMVNHNYNLVKFNREDSSKKFQIAMNEINEFYDKVDHMIKWYIENALDYLKSASLIIWREVNRVCMEESDGKSVIDQDGNIEVNVNLTSHQASKKEMDFYSKCIEIADKEAGIESAGERYYSHKAPHFQEVLKRELYKEKIKYVYNTYEAYYVHLDKCKALLDSFGKFDRKKLINDFTKEFTSMILENAESRFDKNSAKYLLSKDEYLISFGNLCEIAIDNNTEYLGKRIKSKGIEDDYNLKINTTRKRKKKNEL